MSPEARNCQPNTAEAAYHKIAPEYYDSNRHPTCANFRDASARGLRIWFDRCCDPYTHLIEVGAGKSIVLEYLNKSGIQLSKFLVTDASPIMLNYSRNLKTGREQFKVASAEHLPALDGEFSVLVASLGDPYNNFSFWCEAYRILRPNGKILFTTPTHEWATCFRRNKDKNIAEFELSDGQKIFAPSFIFSVDEQVDLMRSAGFRTLAIREVWLNEIDNSCISTKLTLAELSCVPIVRAYLGQI